MKLTKEETYLTGKWIFKNGRITKDSVTKRIIWLKDNYLIKLANDAIGWETLYEDPEDGRYLELIYEQSDLQGGGPLSLRVVSKEEANVKYSLN